MVWGSREETSSAYYQDKPKSEKKIEQSSPEQFVLGLQRDGTVVGDFLVMTVLLY